MSSDATPGPATSGYRERPPPPVLAGAVACLWRDAVTAAREQRVLPDGCMDLIWMDGAVHVAGPDTGPFLAALAPGTRIAGLRFRPGAAPALLGVPADAVRDTRARLADLWGASAAAGLAGRLQAAADPATVLADAVLDRGAQPPDHALTVVVARLRAGTGVAATADALGWTERTLHRRCCAAFGYGPAVLRRILRFRAALRLAGSGVPLAETAARAGFADQSHLAREARALAGVPLRQLVAGSRSANRSTPLPSGSWTTA